MNKTINFDEVIYKLALFKQIHTSYFSINDFYKFSNIPTSPMLNLFIKDFLIASGLVYIDLTENKNEIFIFKQNFFINKKFRIKISHFEKNRLIFIPASRFSPFMPNELGFHDIKIYFEGKPIPQKKIQASFQELNNFYFLSTENDLLNTLTVQDQRNSQIIKKYENGQRNIEFYISVFDFSKIYTKLKLSSLSWLSVKIINWESGEFELLSDAEFEPENSYINSWYDNFEFFVKASLNILPIDVTVNDIIGLSYFLGREKIFTEKNIPMECFFEERNSFAICRYGIEEKFWMTSKPIPIPKTWFLSISSTESHIDNFFSKLNFPVTKQILEQLCLDFLSKHHIDKFNNTVREEFINTYVSIFIYEKLFNHKKKKIICTKILSDIYDEYVATYNPFTDIELHNFRHSISESYKSLIQLLKKINEKKIKPKDVKTDSPLMLYQVFKKIEYAFIFISKIDIKQLDGYHTIYDFLDNFENMCLYVKEVIESDLSDFL